MNDSYKPLIGIDPVTKKDVRSLVVMEEAQHGKVRRAVANAFTVNSAAEMEDIIQISVGDLVERLDDVAKKGEVIDMSEMLLYYSLDNATVSIFSEPGGHLRTQSDVDGLGGMARERLAYWGYWSALPNVERWIYRNPIALMFKSQLPASFARKLAARINDRIAKPHLSTQPDLLNKLIDTKQKYPDVMDVKGTLGIAMSVISGAGDTTATTMAAILYHLISHPQVLQKLEEELDTAGITTPVPRYGETRNLPYLDAVIKESMRLHPILNWPMERVVPKNGFTIANTFLPAGTSCGVSLSVMHMDRFVYGDDVEVFRPERWLSGDVQRTKKMEASFLGFSRGKRVCLGQHIAVMQLKKVLAMMVTRYNLQFENPAQKLDADYSGAVVIMQALPMRLGRKVE